jgi:hypothetical protein
VQGRVDGGLGGLLTRVLREVAADLLERKGVVADELRRLVQEGGC